ncbi:MAG: hypothetical protein ACKVWR_02140 [Acidimicrobiales bacterium]
MTDEIASLAPVEKLLQLLFEGVLPALKLSMMEHVSAIRLRDVQLIAPIHLGDVALIAASAEASNMLISDRRSSWVLISDRRSSWSSVSTPEMVVVRARVSTCRRGVRYCPGRLGLFKAQDW